MRRAALVAATVLAASALAGALWAAAEPVSAPGVPTLAEATSAGGAHAARTADECQGAAPSGVGSAPAARYEGDAIGGTTTEDLRSFALRYNELRIAACLDPVPADRFRWSDCLEQRLVWIASDPSTDPGSAWGHEGTERSDGVPSAGCDGNLAGGDANSGATVAAKWWDSLPHRASLYRPGEDLGEACIAFAMTHGGLPDEPASFSRAAAVWTDCAGR